MRREPATMSNYIQWLRDRIGHRKTLLVYTTALIRDDAGRVLFQRRSDFREAWWGLPGGVLEIGESFTDCVKREAYEETGYHVEPIQLIGLYCSPEWDVRYPNGDEVQQYTVALECRIVGGRSRPDGHETISHHFFALDDLPDHIPPWYAAMVRDLKCRTNGAYFDQPVVSDPNNSYMAKLRELVGADRLIIAGAGAIIRDDRGRVLLGLRGDNHLWGLPAGQMELGESPAGTVIRETYEEVGLHVRPTQLVGVFTGPDAFHTYTDGNQVQIARTIFRADMIGGELNPDNYETLDAQWFDLEHLPPMVERHQRALYIASEHPDGGQFQ